MSVIGLRSGKIASGLYRFGDYTIKNVKGWWRIYRNYGTDAEVMMAQAESLTAAQNWCRQN